MKKISFLLLLAGLSGCFHRAPSVTTGLEGKALPSFKLLLLDSVSQFNTASIPAGEPVILFYFNPNCPYCRAQTEEITTNMKSLHNIRFYLLSNFPLDPIKKYYADYKLNKYSNILVGQDFDFYFSKYFNATGVPYIAIFGRDKHLKQVFMGKIDSKTINDIAFE